MLDEKVSIIIARIPEICKNADSKKYNDGISIQLFAMETKHLYNNNNKAFNPK
jgi:hypothetical protein